MKIRILARICIGYLKCSYPIFIGLYLCWFLFTFDFSLYNSIFGFVLSIFLTFSAQSILYSKACYKKQLPRLIVLIPYILKLIFEIYRSSYSFILRIIKNDSCPVVTIVDVAVEESFSKAIIANSITLTPGTITIDTDENRLYVLSIKDDTENGEATRRSIKTKFEKPFLAKSGKGSE